MDGIFPFLLDEPEREAVAAIVGQEYIECIEEAVTVYYLKKRFYKDRHSIPQLNQSLAEIIDHIAPLIKLLHNTQLRDYLFSISLESFRDQGGRLFISEKNPFINKTAMLQGLDLDALERLEKVCDVAIKKQKPGPGRPKGQKDEAAHTLLNLLCQCCESANDRKKLTTKKGNMLEQLMQVLRKPLGFGEGELTGLTRNTIEKRKMKPI